MISEKMKPYVKNNSAIRIMFEEGNRLRAKYGADKVFDFSLGNPSVPAPDSVREAIIELVNTTDPTVLHGYMSNAGFEDVRQTIAESLNRRFDTKFSAKNLIMTVGCGIVLLLLILGIIIACIPQNSLLRNPETLAGCPTVFYWILCFLIWMEFPY